MLIRYEKIAAKDASIEDFVEAMFSPLDKARADALAWIKGAMIVEAERCCADICTWCSLQGNRIRPPVLVDGEWLHYDERDQILGRCNAAPIHHRLKIKRATEHINPKFPGYTIASIPQVSAEPVAIKCPHCQGSGKDKNILDWECVSCKGNGWIKKA